MTTASWLESATVTGSQKFTNYARIVSDFRALKPIGLKRISQGGHNIDEQFGGEEWPKEIVSADSIAWLAANEPDLCLDGMTYRVNRAPDPGATVPAWTNEDGKWPAAGVKRSVRMLRAEKPGLVLGYPLPNSKGTWHCIRAAVRMHIIVVVWAPHLTREAVAATIGPCSIIVDAEGSRFLIARHAHDVTVERRRVLIEAFAAQRQAETRTP